jgi:hypothetical protein
LTAAFDAALNKLGLVDRQDPVTMTVAKLITQLAKDGERDPEKLCDGVLKIRVPVLLLHRVMSAYGCRLNRSTQHRR